MSSLVSGLAGRRPPFAGGRFYYGWIQIWIISFTELVSWGILYYAFSVLIVPMGADLGWSRVEMTAAFSVGGLVAGLCGIPVGRWVDVRGARALMTIGSVLAVALVLAWAGVQSLPMFFLIWAGIGVAMAAVLYEPTFVIAATWFRRDRARAMAVLTFVGGLASVVFLPLTSWLEQSFGWRESLVVLAAIMAVTTIVPHYLFVRHRPADLDLEPDGLREVEVLHETSGTGGAPPSPAAAEPEVTLGTALHVPAFWWMASSFAIIWGCAVAVQIHLIPYLQDQGFSPAFAATAAGAIGLLKLPGRLLFAPMAERFGQQAIGIGIFATHAAGIAMLALATNAWGVYLFVILFSAGNGSLTLMRASLVAEAFGLRAYGSISGSMAFVSQVAMAAGPLVVSLLVAAWGGYIPVFWVLAAVVVVSSFGITRTVPRPSPAAASIQPS